MKKQKTIKPLSIILIILLLVQILVFNSNVKANTYEQISKVGIENFPEDYKEKLVALNEMYPNWKFTAFYTGIRWNDFIEAETSVHLRNTVIKTSDNLWIDSCEKIASGYACASTSIIQYFSDPRNFLNESGIFQFLDMTYNKNIQDEESVKSIIKNTFMDKEIPVTIKVGEEEEEEITMHYSKIIMEAAQKSNMSPYNIAIKIIQEVGRKGSSSVSGYYVGSDGTIYEGYYNFFNYGAYDSGDAIANGLLYAKENEWTNPYIAIIDGAKLMANSYTNAGQNTAYFYKWDVIGSKTSELFWHQYMTNIQDPASQAKSLYNTYASNEILSAQLNFIIPVFEDMPNANNLPTTIDTTLESSYYLTGNDVRLRESPSTSSSILATLNRDTVVTLLNWNVATSNGYDWAKIRLENGTEGYIANIYLKPCNKMNENGNTNLENNSEHENNNQAPNQNNENEIGQDKPVESIENEELKSKNDKKVKIDGENIIIIPKLSNEELKELLNINQYVLLDRENNDITYNNLVLTGNKIKIGEKIYNLFIFGDVNGDGEVNSLDALKILKYDVGAVELNEEYLKISDVNNNGNVDSLDALKILKYDVSLAEITL